MQTVSHKQEMQMSTLNGYFSLTDFPIFIQIVKVQAVDEIDKLYKCNENQTKNKDFIV